MTPTAKEELISVREAARKCGRNMETVRRWIWSGKLPAEKLGNQLFIKKNDLASYCREKVVQYKAGPKTDFLQEAKAFQNKLRAKGVRPIDAAEEIRKMREERVNQIERSLQDTADALHRKKAMLEFLKKAKALRNEVHARTGEVFDTEVMIRELRDEREHELE